jgi:hypothetical protein
LVTRSTRRSGIARDLCDDRRIEIATGAPFHGRCGTPLGSCDRCTAQRTLIDPNFALPRRRLHLLSGLTGSTTSTDLGSTLLSDGQLLPRWACASRGLPAPSTAIVSARPAPRR